MHWFIDPIQNHYADFTGRVGRQEFWVFILAAIIVSILPVVGGVLRLLLLLPVLGMGARRLHDSGHSALWLFLVMIVQMAGVFLAFSIIFGAALTGGEALFSMLLFLSPVILLGVILPIGVLIYFWCQPTQPEINKYGAPAVPKTGGEGEAASDNTASSTPAEPVVATPEHTPEKES